MASVKLLFIQCTLLLLLISVPTRSEEIQRDKRDLKFIKNLLSSTVFGHKPEITLVEDGKEDAIQVPKGYKVIYVKRVPGDIPVHQNTAINSKINIIKAFLGTKTVKETEKAMESAKDLIQSGIITEKDVIPLRVGSSQRQFKEVFIPEQQGFFSSELHAPSIFAPKPFVNSFSIANIEAPFVIESSEPPRSSFGEVLNSSFVVSKPIVGIPNLRNRFSYKQSYHDGSRVVYDGSIRTGDRIPQPITNNIQYVIPPPFFVNRIQNIPVAPTISAPVKSAYSYKIIHNHGSAVPEHKITLPQYENIFAQQFPSPQATTSTKFERNKVVVPIHPSSFVSSNSIPIKHNTWQSPTVPHIYRYVQSYSPYTNQVLPVNFNQNSIINKDFSNKNAESNPQIPGQSDYINIHSTNIIDKNNNAIQNNLPHIDSLPNVSQPAQTNNLNIHNNNYNANKNHVDENNLPGINTLPKSSVKYFKTEVVKIPNFSSSEKKIPQLVEKVNNNYDSTNHYTFTQKDGSGNNIIYKNDQVFVEVNPNVPPTIASALTNNQEELITSAPTYTYETDNISLPKTSNETPFTTSHTDSRSNFALTTNTSPEISHLSSATQEIYTNQHLPKEVNENASVSINPAVQVKRRKVFRRVKVKQNAIRNFQKYEAPSNDNEPSKIESLNNKPIVVLPESTFSYKQINGDGSTRTIHENENNAVVVDVQKNNENFSNRGDIPL